LKCIFRVKIYNHWDRRTVLISQKCRYIENFYFWVSQAVFGTNISAEPASSYALKMEAGGFSKILICMYQTTWHHIPE
jgi:hypothetical protein